MSESRQRSSIDEREHARAAAELHGDIAKRIYLGEIDKAFESEKITPDDYPRMLEICAKFAVSAADRLLWQMSQPREILGTKPPDAD